MEVYFKDATIEQLLPVFLSLLKDKFPDVRLNKSSSLIKSIRERVLHLCLQQDNFQVDETVQHAKIEGNLPTSFVNSIQKPCDVIMLVKARAPVDQTIATLVAHLEQGDCIIDGGNEWYENTERREKAMEEHGLLYLGMGVSGGEEGARHMVPP